MAPLGKARSAAELVGATRAVPTFTGLGPYRMSAPLVTAEAIQTWTAISSRPAWFIRPHNAAPVEHLMDSRAARKCDLCQQRPFAGNGLLCHWHRTSAIGTRNISSSTAAASQSGRSVAAPSAENSGLG